jgi:hypothetical protein
MINEKVSKPQPTKQKPSKFKQLDRVKQPRKQYTKKNSIARKEPINDNFTIHFD